MARSLDDYKKKRDFGRTPEPSPRAPHPREVEDRFVIHRHDASNLHWDLRLEIEGVLKSWAVPRGLSFDPADKRLAVRTEDHPMEYLAFEGVIPKGEYGAGTMTVWDSGTYEIISHPEKEGIDKGKLEIYLRGRRFRGEWHLVLTKGGKSNEWLLFKASDRFAASGGRSKPGDLSAATVRRLERSPRRMRPGKSAEPFSDHDWFFEMDFRGLRVAIEKNGEEVRVRSGRKDLARRLQGLVHDLRLMRAESARLDGVLVISDGDGRPSRDLLDDALAEAGELSGVQLYLFDLLTFEELDLRRVPLIERKAQLRYALESTQRVLEVDPVRGRGEDLCAMVARTGLGGVIAKRADSFYVAGASPSWIEIRMPEQDETSSIRETLEATSRGGAPRVPGVKFSNLEKVLWPEDGFTKGDLIRYYDRIADTILPYLVDRPVHLRRMPDGVDGQAFYQRRPPEHLPKWVETVEVRSSDGETERHIVCSDRRTLLYLANLASIDLHPWFSRRGSLASPDWAILDLDPKEAPFRNVVKVARAVGKVLDAVGIPGWPKTSGKTGLHITIPVLPGYDYDQVRGFTEVLARIVARDNAAVATITRNPARREGKVYLDFLQIFRGQTVVAPYTVRPMPKPRVSMPLSWDELDETLDPNDFTIVTAPDRLERRGDLYAPILSEGIDLLPALESLQTYALK